jgi:peroxiredoxin
MKKLCFCFSLFLVSNTAVAQNSIPGKPIGYPSKILKDGVSMVYYNHDYLKTTEDFTAYNTSSHLISKMKFFQLFATGNYLPMRLSGSGNSYQLYKVSSNTSEDVHSVLQSYGKTAYTHYKMEGKIFPGLNYTDINGKVYNSENTKGKIIVLKCWFLHCKACNEEIPALNKLVDIYKIRKDVVFISIAFDPRDKLKAFSKKSIFKYALAPVKEAYIEKELGTNEYPTHFLINKQGLIVKEVNDASELAVALSKEASK